MPERQLSAASKSKLPMRSARVLISAGVSTPLRRDFALTMSSAASPSSLSSSCFSLISGSLMLAGSPPVSLEPLPAPSSGSALAMAAIVGSRAPTVTLSTPQHRIPS